MGFQVGLGHQVDAVLVAQLVPARVIGVVAGAHVVAVHRLDQFQIVDHPLLGNIMARIGPVFVAVGPLSLTGTPLIMKTGPLISTLRKPVLVEMIFFGLAAVAHDAQHRRVEVRRLGRPLLSNTWNLVISN